MNKWMIVTSEKCKAVSKIAAAVQKYVSYRLPVSSVPANNYNPIYVSIVRSEKDINIDVEAYDKNTDSQTIRISAANEINLLYAASTFENHYLPLAEESQNSSIVFNPLFIEPMKEYHYHSSPYINRRGIWTWGHVIYDYKKFIDNMVALRLNDLVIWNDYVPINIREVLDYAHSNGVFIQLGFSWGWDTLMPDISHWNEIADKIIEKYIKEYYNIPCDGIYFQTFTEHKEEYLNGLNVAETAVKLVNKVSQAIFELKPETTIQFGLHVGSVIKHLDAFGNLNPKVSIIWEDVGAFPFSYLPYQTENFENTLELNRKLQKLGGTENGAVLKGIICLDWTKFEHQLGTYYMGECSSSDIKITDIAKKKLRMVQAYWLANVDLVRRMMVSFPAQSTVLALVEDGYFENYINFPIAAYAEIMWDPSMQNEELIKLAARRPDVVFF